MVDNNENNLYLPFELRPGTDVTSKFIMNDKTVKNIIIHELLGSNISNNLYHSASTEWSDGTKSDVLYVPTEVNNDQPPILIEIQNSVDQAFMIRLIQYCTRVYERFQVLPVVLVFVAVKFSSKEFEKKKIVPKVNTPYLLEASCEFWAQEVNFISAKSIENHIKVGMNQLVALAYFTTCQSASLSLLEYAGDSTVRFLYSICKANMKKKGDGGLVKIIDQSTEQIRKAIGLDEDPILTAEKCKGFAENLLETIEIQKRKLVEVYELNAEASQKQQKKYIAEDFEFIESSSEPGKPKKWKKIYDEGKAKGLFISYTSSNSLKSAYHHSKKREKTRK